MNTKREAAFYRKLLEQICQSKRNTMARKLALSGLTFWDAIQSEKLKRAKRKPSGTPHKAVRVQQDYSEKLNRITAARHRGLHLTRSCEECGEPTRYEVLICGGRWAAWCGCAP